MKIGFIDHYDSFSANLVDWLSQDPEFPVQIEQAFSDDTDKLTHFYARSFPLVFSPGPKTPRDAPGSQKLMKDSLGRVPILGVCLGFQLLGELAGLELLQAESVRYGVAREFRWSLPRLSKQHDSSLPQAGTCKAAVYNSLGFSAIAARKLALPWELGAEDEYGNAQILMYSAKSESENAALGLQFHPESFLSQGVEVFRRWWLAMALRSIQTKSQRSHPY